MVKKWRSCLSLLVSFAFILSMLFSVTLEVKAAGLADVIDRYIIYNQSNVFYNDYYLYYGGDSTYVQVGGTTYDNTSTSHHTVYDNYQLNSGHVSLPCFFSIGSSSDIGLLQGFDESAYYFLICLNPNITYSWSDGSTSRSCTFSNIVFKDSNGRVFSNVKQSTNPYSSYTYVKGQDIVNSSSGGSPFVVTGSVEFDYNITDRNYSSGSFPSDSVCMIFHPIYDGYLATLKDGFKYDIGSVNTTDSITHQQLTELNASSSAIQESVTSDTGGGLLATIKSWFGSFFDNLIGVFVPDSDYFTTWFTNVNTLLSDKLGMLYAPFDLLISVLNAVYSSSTDFSGIPFPEIRWGDSVLVSAQNLTFSNLLGEYFEDIQGYVYFGTDVVLLFAFLMLLQRKITLVLRGHESG